MRHSNKLEMYTFRLRGSKYFKLTAQTYDALVTLSSHVITRYHIDCAAWCCFHVPYTRTLNYPNYSNWAHCWLNWWHDKFRMCFYVVKRYLPQHQMGQLSWIHHVLCWAETSSKQASEETARRNSSVKKLWINRYFYCQNWLYWDFRYMFSHPDTLNI